MNFKSLLVIASLLAPNLAIAAEPIYVVRPHVPRVAAGVLPQNAFADNDASPETPAGEGEGSDLPYRYVSMWYNDNVGKIPGYEATVQIGGEYYYKPPIQTANPRQDLYCMILGPEDLDTRGWFYDWVRDDGLLFQFPKADKFGHSEWRKEPGIFAFYVNCLLYERDGANQKLIARSDETLTITTAK